MTDRTAPNERPWLSIVVGARAGEGSATACLDALADQVGDGVEVIVAADDDASEPCPQWARRVVLAGGLVPELWAAGIDEASGRLIGLLASTTVPVDGWVASTRAAHDATAIVGGSIEPGDGLSLVDWAVYFCRYSPYLRPLLDAGRLEVPGDNASYDGDVLRRYQELFRSGFWEPTVHAALRADGHRQAFCESRVVRATPGADAGRFRRQRLAHGREHGRLRSIGVPRWRTAVGVATAPLVPPVMTARAAATVFGKRRLRGRFVLASPLILWFYAWWALGELNGRLDALRGRPQ